MTNEKKNTGATNLEAQGGKGVTVTLEAAQALQEAARAVELAHSFFLQVLRSCLGEEE